MRTLLGVAFLMVACAGESSPPRDPPHPPLAGLWSTLVRDDTCLETLGLFPDGGRYEQRFECGTGREIEGGAADFSRPGVIAFTPKQTSCPAHDHVARTLSFHWDETGNLAVGPLVLDRYDSGFESGACVVAPATGQCPETPAGCVEEGRIFTPHAIVGL
jgi:hypothetical protein